MRFAAMLALVSGAFISTQALAASFVTPSFFEVIYVDSDREFGLKKTSEVEIEAGEHQLLVRYSQKFEVKKKNEVVRSQPIVIDLNIPAGATLSLRAEQPQNFRMAGKYALAPEFKIVDSKGYVVDYQSQLLPKVKGMQLGRDYLKEAAALKGVPTSTEKPTAPPAKTADNTELVMLKQWYNQADTPSRKAYKIWSITPENTLVHESTELDMLKFWHERADESTRKAFQMWLLQ